MSFSPLYPPVIAPFRKVGVAGYDYADNPARLALEHNEKVSSAAGLSAGGQTVCFYLTAKREIIENFFRFPWVNFMSGNMVYIAIIPLKPTYLQ